jgi:hypothetical protein
VEMANRARVRMIFDGTANVVSVLAKAQRRKEKNAKPWTYDGIAIIPWSVFAAWRLDPQAEALVRQSEIGEKESHAKPRRRKGRKTVEAYDGLAIIPELLHDRVMLDGR